MPPKHHCATCAAEWTAGAFTGGCAECGGGAMERDCPVCGGQCGSRWQRAVIDSHDRHEAHWIGNCNRARTPGPGDQVEWWLDVSALPDLYWAELAPIAAGWMVRDLDGVEHPFTSHDAAIAWLREEEYAALDDLKREGEIPSSVVAPRR